MLVLVAFFPDALAISRRSSTVIVPQHCGLLTPPGIKSERVTANSYRLYYSHDTVFPLRVKITDLFGAHVEFTLHEPKDVYNLTVPHGRITSPQANVYSLSILPKLCERAVLSGEGKKFLIYEGKKDIANHIPTLHLLDPDMTENLAQFAATLAFDDKNVLSLVRVAITYDYEDTAILDYNGPHPVTGKEGHLVYEGEGGFYANFHYALVPYDARILKLDRQTLLHLVHGSLKEIGRKDLLPAVRMHSLLPGPYQSHGELYPLCEWGDTAFQAPKQEVFYTGISLWDWDVGPWDKLIFIVWEGDEEGWLVADALLDPYYLTDDIVGVFVFSRAETLKPLTLVNEAKNFTITVRTQ